MFVLVVGQDRLPAPAELQDHGAGPDDFDHPPRGAGRGLGDVRRGDEEDELGFLVAVGAALDVVEGAREGDEGA